jgi:hypothetical protein
VSPFIWEWNGNGGEPDLNVVPVRAHDSRKWKDVNPSCAKHVEKNGTGVVSGSSTSTKMALVKELLKELGKA